MDPLATPPSVAPDPWLFGWDPTPGIVSVWADRAGRALVWQRAGAQVRCTREWFRPWLLAADLADLAYLGPALVPAGDPAAGQAAVTYQELADPPPAAYRYRLSAADGRALEAAICQGAADRRGTPVPRLGALGAAYYQIGPVEQYLMATGRVYFRDLRFADLHRLQFDLETTALDPQQGRIFLIAVRDSQGLATVLEAPTPADEAHLIAALCTLIRERDPDVIENHNLLGFDLPFLVSRARALRIPLALGRAPGASLLTTYAAPGRRRRETRYSIAGRELIDTLDAVLRYDFAARTLPGYGLKAVARHFGVAAPDRVYLPGAAVWPTYQQTPEQVRCYALDDVAEVDGLAQRLLGAAFALAGMAPRAYERVAAAGPATGILEPLLVRAYLHAGAAVPQAPTARATTGHQGGATILFAGGVARQVVKADIASMYPSIMRAYGIGPATDELGVLLGLVGRLTDLRLAHKQAARAPGLALVEAHAHEATQAAMKILVNSAYGYLGAGAMALFADRAAADAITERGRAILEQVVNGLRDQGMLLLEADTDGVYFAAPVGWSEEQERAVVAGVAATLPAGLRLEYEGRYRAMLCHEVKNYALLTYEGQLIVRGGAFRSSRAEPFGVAFLTAAIRCTLEEDLPGLVTLYQATVAALRARTLPVSQVATRARLTKTPGEYRQSRSRAREAPYEALLGAGQTHWEVGERVRYYRAGGGRYVWLPEAAEEGEGEGSAAQAAGPRDYDVEHYLRVLHLSYVERLRKAFAPEDFAQLFRADGQTGLFDRPLAALRPAWLTSP